ncbi:hypothetical protein D9M69_431470 [compost metagenome]
MKAATFTSSASLSSPLNSTRLIPRVGTSGSAGKYSATSCQTMSCMARPSTLESTVSMESGDWAIRAWASRNASMKLA